MLASVLSCGMERSRNEPHALSFRPAASGVSIATVRGRDARESNYTRANCALGMRAAEPKSDRRARAKINESGATKRERETEKGRVARCEDQIMYKRTVHSSKSPRR